MGLIRFNPNATVSVHDLRAKLLSDARFCRVDASAEWDLKASAHMSGQAAYAFEILEWLETVLSRRLA